jgi:hypothetical protein
MSRNKFRRWLLRHPWAIKGRLRWLMRGPWYPRPSEFDEFTTAEFETYLDVTGIAADVRASSLSALVTAVEEARQT